MYTLFKFFVALFLVFGLVFQSSAQTNIDFEQTAPGIYSASNAVTGWTLETANASLYSILCSTNIPWSPGSSEFSVVATPIMGNPYTWTNPFSIDNVSIMNSPLGGNNVVRMQDAIGTGIATRLRTSFPVTTLNSAFYLACAGSWGGSMQSCCAGSCFQLKIYGCNGSFTNCISANFTPNGPQCTNGSPGYTVTNNTSWKDWQTSYYDLSMFIGSCVTIEIVNSDGVLNSGHSSVFLDAKTGPSNFPGAGSPGPTGIFTISCFPMPPVFYCSNSSTALLFAPPGYISYQWYAPGSPPIAMPASSGGNSPTLTISSPIISNVYTCQVATATGCTFAILDTIQYSSVSVAGIGSTSASCGNTNGSATVVAGGGANGYNYVWFSQGNPKPISTNSVISNLAPGVYTVGVSSFYSAGCGSAVATVTVGVNNVSTNIHYYCSNITTLSAPLNATSVQWYNGLSAISASLGGAAQNYTVTSPFNNQYFWLAYNSSGSCRDSMKIILTPAVPGPVNFAVVPQATTVCQGGSMTASVNIAGPIAQYNFSWSPSTFLNGSNQSSITISPSTAIGSTNSIVYTVGVTPTAGICPTSKTFTVNYVNPPSTTIGFIPALCVNSASFTLTANPPGGFFSGSYPQFNGGVITPSLGAPGLHTFFYNSVFNGCPASASGTYVVNLTPTISITGNTVICSGDVTSLYATGANTFTWNTTITGPTIAISPSITSYYSVVGTDTLTNCSDTKSVLVTVKPLPTLSITGNTTICEGEVAMIFVSGANGGYVWSNGSTNNTLVVSPVGTTSYSVVGTGTFGCKNSTIVTILVSECTDIGELSDHGHLIQIYPNPSSDFLFIELGSLAQLTLYDQYCAKLIDEQFEVGRHIISLSDFSPGFYVLKCVENKNSGKTKTIKVVRIAQ